MKTDKPREFWITKNDKGEPTHIALFEKLNDRQQIHVIEYKAVEQLEQRVAAQERVIAKLKEQRKALVYENYNPDGHAQEVIKELDEELEQLTKESK